MSGIVDMITGASAKKAARLQAAALESSNNAAIANLARSSADTDQATATTTGPRGRRLLTFIGASGKETMA